MAALKTVHIVEMLPRRRSGKVLRATLRAIANAYDVATPRMIEKPAALDAIAACSKAAFVAHSLPTPNTTS